MRIARILHEGRPESTTVTQDGAVRLIAGEAAPERDQPARMLGTVEDVQFLAPCVPSKILCVGRNYASSVRSRGHPWPEMPFVFLKTPNAVVGPDAVVLRPEGIDTFGYEGELAVVIGKTATRIRAADVNDYILGYTVGNDMTVRDWQASDPHWTRAKSSDTLCPLGPWIETELDPANLVIETRVNGELQQQGRTNDLIFSIGEIIAFISRTMTLVPGDVVLTGAPIGTRPVVAGDEVAVTVEGIGTLRNIIEQAPPAPATAGAST
jgi:2-keto-4-pentenoate hydratase/2-oxohepta-3-ene-1,7-dioic acid hydratase in catechol pathway